MEWFNKYAPGLLCVGQKRHSFGNKIHNIFLVKCLFCGELRKWKAKITLKS